MNSEDAINPLVGNIFSRLDEQDHHMDQFAMALQTLLSHTAHLESPTVAAPVQPVLQAIPAAAPLSVQAPALSITSIRDTIKDETAARDIPTELERLIMFAILIDSRLRERFPFKERLRKPPKDKPLVLVTISWAESSVEIQALIDSMAAGLFIDAAFVSEHSIPLQLCDTPLAIEALDGRPLQPAYVTHETVPLSMAIGSLPHEIIQFQVISSPKFL
ncbi:hypothetical protein AB205_0204860, partial [Aquarana catesbeiana]